MGKPYFLGKKELFKGLAIEKLEKGYLIPYVADNRALIKVGVSFSSEERNISEWITID